MEGEDMAMMPPKKRGAAAVSAGEEAGDPKRAKGASGRAARAAGRGHEDAPEEEVHPQADAAQEAIEAAAAQAPGKRARKPSAKQAAAAQQALEQVAAQDAAAPEQPPQAEPKVELQAGQQEVSAVPPQLPPELAPPAPEEQPPPPQQQPSAADAAAEAADVALPPEQAAPYAADATADTAAAAAAAAAAAPQPVDAQESAPTDAHAAASNAEPIAMAAGGGAAAAVPEHQAHLAAADPGQQQQPQQQQPAQLQPQEMQGYDAVQQQQHLEAAHQAQLQQLYAQQHMDVHAQGGVQPEGAPGDLQALFDPSALVVGIALVVPDENGQDAHHDPVAISVHAQATVADLKQRIFSTSIYGQTFPPAQQELQMITPEGQGIFMEDVSPQGQPHSLADYGLTPGAAHRPTLYLRIRAGEVVPGEGGAVAVEQPELNPDGSEKKKRRQHTRWKEEEVMRLLEGVESLGVGHWRQMQRDFNLMDRTDVDLKDKWRNITKAIAQNKKMRGFNMAADMMLRVQNCMRLAQEKKAMKAQNEAASAAAQVAGQGLDMLEGGAPPPLEHQQVQHADPAAAAAQQAAAEGAAVQGVLDGALPQQAEGDVHVDIMDPAAAGGQYQQQLQAPEQPQQQQGPELTPQQQQELAIATAAHAVQQHAQQQQQQQQQQQYHAGGHDHDPGAVVMPVPQFEDVGHQQGGDAAAAQPTSGAALPSAPPLDI